MPYEIYYDDEKNIAELILKNTASLEESIKAGKEAVSICNNNKSKCVLMDMEKIITKGSLNTFELYELGVAWRYETGNGAINFAVILPMDPNSKEDINFFVTVGVNRGVVIKSFHHRDQARDWLMNQAAK
jgi:hypothetical protein